MIPDACTSISDLMVIPPNDDIDAAFDASIINVSIVQRFVLTLFILKKKNI